jgi:hypothetical protein
LDDENFIKAIVDDNILIEALRAPSLEVNIFYYRLKGIGEISRLILSQVDYLDSLYCTSTAKLHLDQND